MNEKSPSRKNARARDDATRHIRSLLDKNVDADMSGRVVEKPSRPWTRKRTQGRILWIKRLTE
jgi:hypothetical protein